jgi:elongation factor P
MIPVTGLRAGTTFLLDGQPYKVLQYSHIKMGRGNATIKVKIKNLINGAITEKSFASGAALAPVNTTKRSLQFLYQDNENAYFMDPVTFEQIEIPKEVLSRELVFLKEGETASILFWEDKPLSIELPPRVTLKVVETDPGIRGNSATNVYKQAQLENGLLVKVPLFINPGDKVRIDTRTGEYVERA